MFFASANTQERPTATIDDALADLNTDAHHELLRHAHGSSAVGVWTDGAEGSVVGHRSKESATALGRKHGQKSILWWEAGDGTDRLHRIYHDGRGPEDLKHIDGALASAGIEHRTTTANGLVSYVLDTDGSLAPKVHAAAKLLGSKVHTEPGTAEFVNTSD